MSGETDTGTRCALFMDVVSVQSQVVYGHVGNNAAPTLRAWPERGRADGHVQQHPHYPTLHGGALPIDWFGDT
jgi:pyridoxine kinase